ncbi:MAG: AzlD domain-containing protein [Synergistales bacterium]|nr:AzlD domain-containing protein [Synergistales bacterium]
MYYYLLFAVIALSSLVIKGLFLCFIPPHKIPPFFEKTLRYIPPAALSALVAPSIIYAKGAEGMVISSPRILAGGLAFLVAMKSRNIFVTIVSGMILLWAFSCFVPF